MSASPVAFRWALVIALSVTFPLAFGALDDVWLATHLDAPPQMADNYFGPQLKLSAEAQRDVYLAGQSGMSSAIANMAPARIGVSVLLAMSAFSVVVLLFRLRFTASTELAQWLSRAATATAVLRTLSGAQNLVIARRMAGAFGKALEAQKLPPELSDTAALIMAAVSTASVVWSLVIVGCFLGLAAYFRSDGLRELLTRAARETE